MQICAFFLSLCLVSLNLRQWVDDDSVEIRFVVSCKHPLPHLGLSLPAKTCAGWYKNCLPAFLSLHSAAVEATRPCLKCHHFIRMTDDTVPAGPAQG